MAWNNVSRHCHHIKIFISFLELQSHKWILSWYAMKKINPFFIDFVNKKVLNTICHDVHVYKLHLYEIH
jgi:hypothetical protein